LIVKSPSEVLLRSSVPVGFTRYCVGSGIFFGELNE